MIYVFESLKFLPHSWLYIIACSFISTISDCIQIEISNRFSHMSATLISTVKLEAISYEVVLPFNTDVYRVVNPSLKVVILLICYILWKRQEGSFIHCSFALFVWLLVHHVTLHHFDSSSFRITTNVSLISNYLNGWVFYRASLYPRTAQ